jgi:hypothetical protein
MSAIIYDFKVLGAKLRKQRVDDWWQPWKPEPEPQVAKPSPDQIAAWRRYIEQNSVDPK